MIEFDTSTIIIAVTAAVFSAILSIFLTRRGGSHNPEIKGKIDQIEKNLDVLSERMSDQNRTLYDGLNSSQQSILKQFDLTQKLVKDVTTKLTTLDETNKQIVGFASQLNSLEQILKNPKQRGVLGEYFLEKVLESVLPPQNFQLQYQFSNGETVDAVIFTKEYVIPIDAKFSLASYNKMVAASTKQEREEHSKTFRTDLKGRINETAKYIRPEHGTYDFAFMFVPADGIYYELLNLEIASNTGSEQTIIEYAFGKKVIIVSPVTLFAYLQTVLQGLRALKIEESVKQIQKHISSLQKHFGRYSHNLAKLGTHLGHAVSSYNKTNNEMKSISNQMDKITGQATPNLEISQEVNQPHDN